jgi:hypothetical protein
MLIGSEISIVISQKHVANGIVEAIDGLPLVGDENDKKIPTCYGDECVTGTVIVRDICISLHYLNCVPKNSRK